MNWTAASTKSLMSWLLSARPCVRRIALTCSLGVSRKKTMLISLSETPGAVLPPLLPPAHFGWHGGE
jgi:hypothetical protein